MADDNKAAGRRTANALAVSGAVALVSWSDDGLLGNWGQATSYIGPQALRRTLQNLDASTSQLIPEPAPSLPATGPLGCLVKSHFY
jgi:hypothetical protein